MTETPPPSTLSTPSPTERPSWHNSNNDHLDLPTDSEIPSAAAIQAINTINVQKPLYLIVATAQKPHLGIGYKGQLPWPQLKSDMQFFRKATTGEHSTSNINSNSNSIISINDSNNTAKHNAVIMGRKTYESIPSKFRPLAGRVNVIVTRSNVRSLADQILRELTGASADGNGMREPAEYRVVDQATVNGLSGEVVSIVQRDHLQATVVVTNSIETAVEVDARDVFCIGGAEIYRAVLADQRFRGRLRVLQTLVRRVDGGAFDCDVFWPEEMGDENGWRGVEGEVVKGWAGCELPQGGKGWKVEEKAGVEVTVVGWERQQDKKGGV